MFRHTFWKSHIHFVQVCKKEKLYKKIKNSRCYLLYVSKEPAEVGDI